MISTPYTLPNKTFLSICDLVEKTAQDNGCKPAYIFVKDNKDEIRLSYEELDSKARSIAKALTEKLNKGDRVLLLFNPGLEFIETFFGCLYAGLVAVPVYPPNTNKKYWQRLAKIAENAGASLILMDDATMNVGEKQVGNQQWFSTIKCRYSSLELSGVANWKLEQMQPDTLAFLQYTSGSTGAPKGVMVSHGNIISNQDFIKQKFGHDASTTVAGWLPQYHDMGLIGNILQPAFLGVTAVLMSPASFSQRPTLWLEVISKYKVSTSGAPNFGYEYCVEKISQTEKQSLDLSHWKVAFSGAEPVKAETLQKFYSVLKDCGFKYEAFCPCYGLAEVTLMASGGDSTTEPKSICIDKQAYQDQRVEIVAATEQSKMELIACGNFEQQNGAVINPKTKLPSQANEIGEIWLKGSSVAQGYWRNTDLTQQTFKAQVESDDMGEHYLRTGDLGFVHDGQLYITGRLKDLIIIRGKNYYPQDIESTTQSSFDQLRIGHGACFSVTIGGEEQLVYVQEIERTFLRKLALAQMVTKIRNTIRQNFNLNLHDVVLTKPNRVPKTSSGKIRRNHTKQLYLDGQLDTLYSVNAMPQRDVQQEDHPENNQNLSPVSSAIQSLIAKQLKIPKQDVDLNDSISTLGVDSIDSINIINEIEKQFKIKIPLNELLGENSILECIESPANGEPQTHEQETDLEQAQVREASLSENQSTFWKLNHLNKNGHIYNLSAPLLFNSELNANSLAAAIKQVTHAHPVLSSIYQEEGGNLRQNVTSGEHLSSVKIPSDLGTVKQFIQAQVSKKIELDSSLPISFTLYPLEDGRSVLHILAHHIVMDFWSILVLVNELLKSYNAICNEETYRVDSSQNYQSYISRQSALFKSNQYTNDVSQVAESLLDHVRPVPFVTDYSRPVRFEHRGQDSQFTITSHLTKSLKQQCKKQKVTLYTYLLSVLQMMLHRYSGVDKFVIGSPVSQRDGSIEDAIIGCFVDMKMIPSRFDDSLPFTEHLNNTKRTVNKMLKYSHVSTSHVIQRLSSMSANAYQHTADTLLPNVRFVLHKAQILRGVERLLFSNSEHVPVHGLKVSCVPMESNTAHADLVLTVTEAGDELRGAFNFNTDIFSAETIKNFIDSYLKLLSSSLEQPEMNSGRLPMMSQHALEKLPGSEIEYPRPENVSGIHQLFEKQVLLKPEHIAVKYEDEQISYQALNQLANQLARHLNPLECPPGTKIGVSMTRGIDMVTAFLAILKLNCTAVFFDHATPLERRELMQSSVALDWLITNTKDTAWCEVKRRVIHLPETDLTSYKSTNLNRENSETDVAYLLFTSGSTGTPKAVKGLHRGMLNRTEWMLQHCNMGENETILHCTPMSAVRAEREIFFALSSGSTLAISEQAALNDPKVLIQELKKFSATFTASSPSMLEMMLNGYPNEFKTLNQLKHWFIGAELLKQSLVARIQQALVGLRLTYFYGSTEVSSDVSYYDIPNSFNAKVPRIPVGKPLHNTELKILDDNMMVLPPGAPGELYVSGKNLSGGYYEDEALTNEKFIQTSIDNQPEQRLYKTGDLAYYGSDGNLYILGRRGNEINLLGNLVSLTEIESTIEQLPEIENVTVMASFEMDTPTIVAYVVTQSPSYNKIVREHLHDKLPAYMHPAFIIKIDKIPLTALGKIDRKQLPKVNNIDDLQRDVHAAESEYETLIANSWAEILNVKPSSIDINDGFFEMGGNSVLVTQLHSKVQAELNEKTLNLTDIYKYPTIKSLAAFLSESNTQQKENNKASDRAKKRRNAMKRYRATVE